MVVVVQPPTRPEERVAAAPPCARRFAFDFKQILQYIFFQGSTWVSLVTRFAFRSVTLLRTPVCIIIYYNTFNNYIILFNYINYIII